MCTIAAQSVQAMTPDALTGHGCCHFTRYLWYADCQNRIAIQAIQGAAQDCM